MRREHLYKAKQIDTGIWFEGDLIHDIDNFAEHRTCIYQALGKGHWQTVPVDDSTVCEYTGLTDKNGRKIFENDLIGCDMNRVEFFSGEWSINGDRPLFFFRDMEVVGNYFDKGDGEE